ncbi:hypothetical protein B0H14DRAFT_3168154 [Mycena olivaceomarginata]|nr:hypothetical protein B0H14DRAFT_3168154 [Mycena olivaceomarginata]
MYYEARTHKYSKSNPELGVSSTQIYFAPTKRQGKASIVLRDSVAWQQLHTLSFGSLLKCITGDDKLQLRMHALRGRGEKRGLHTPRAGRTAAGRVAVRGARPIRRVQRSGTVGDGDGDGYSEDREWLAFENETREETRRDEMLMVVEGREKVPEETPLFRIPEDGEMKVRARRQSVRPDGCLSVLLSFKGSTDDRRQTASVHHVGGGEAGPERLKAGADGGCREHGDREEAEAREGER